MLLWSFEGARARFHNFGGLTGRGTPLPIPNREVKPARADGTRRATSRESRSPPNYSSRRAAARGSSSLSGASSEPRLARLALRVLRVIEQPERSGGRAP